MNWLVWLDRHAGRILAIALALLALALLAGCGPERPLDPPFSGPPKPTPAAPAQSQDQPAQAQDPIAALRQERDDYKGKLASVESRLRSAEAEKTLAPLRALTAWAAWIGGAVALLAVVGIALLRFGVGLPFGTRLLAGVGIAGLALAACALGLGQALPWLGPAGIGLLVLLVLGGAGWAALSWRRAGQVTAGEWSRYAAHLPTELRTALDQQSLRAQGRYRGLVDQPLPPRKDPPA